jgi:hypothetical protein
MKLQENIDRIKQVMGVINEDKPSIHILRRLPQIERALNQTLYYLSPCEYDDVEYYAEHVLHQLREYFEDYEEEEEVEPFAATNYVAEYLSSEIEEYYNDRKSECEE